MTYTRKNKGVCSRSTTVELEDGIIRDLQVVGGCDGNLKGIGSLVKGMPARDAIERLKGTTCDRKPTSCPDQIARCLEEALAREEE